MGINARARCEDDPGHPTDTFLYSIRKGLSSMQSVSRCCPHLPKSFISSVDYAGAKGTTYSTPALNPHYHKKIFVPRFNFSSIQRKSNLDLPTVRDRILNPPMDSHYSHTKHSHGGASSTSDRGISDFLRTAASSYFPEGGSGGGATSSPPTQHHSSSTSGEKMKPSGGHAAASAKVLLDAAVSKLHKTQSEGGGEGEKIDNAKLAAAAADVLEAAKHYGKFEGNNYGKYVDMAEGYLQKFGQKQGSGNVAVNDNYARPHSSHSTPHVQEDEEENNYNYVRPPASHSTPHVQEDEGENNYLKYFKKAEEYLNKR